MGDGPYGRKRMGGDTRLLLKSVLKISAKQIRHGTHLEFRYYVNFTRHAGMFCIAVTYRRHVCFDRTYTTPCHGFQERGQHSLTLSVLFVQLLTFLMDLHFFC